MSESVIADPGTNAEDPAPPHRLLERLHAARYTIIADLAVDAWVTPEPIPFAERTRGKHLRLTPGQAWGRLFDCGWFRFTGRIPEAGAGQPVVALLDVSGEMLVVDERGVPVRGLTPRASIFDRSLGEPGKTVLALFERATSGEEVTIWADAGANDLFGELPNSGRLTQACLAVRHDAIRDLYFDVEVALDVMHYSGDTRAAEDIGTLLATWAAELDLADPDAVAAARAALAPLLRGAPAQPPLTISAIGHAHLDLAWLWPIRETVRKGARTFSTAVWMLDRYDEYRFMVNQPQLIEWIKCSYPELHARLSAHIAAGRVSVEGALWAEPDTNMPAGESLVRQLLHGQRYCRHEFGRLCRIAWLPDTFGYSGQLPQLFANAGIELFVTQKLSWNLVTRFDHHSFWWAGIDGTAILSHLLPEDTYDGSARPRALAKIRDDYIERGVSAHALMSFGIGDGGGGPGAEHLERLRRSEQLPNLPPVVQRSVDAFYEQFRQDADKLPTWRGELYLERHQGTLTTQAAIKRFLRRLEETLREWEWSSVVADRPIDRARHEAIWREVLLYQFHDILPGSSIKRVYDEAIPRCKTLLAELRAAIATNYEQLARQADPAAAEQPCLAINSLSWSRTGWIELHGRWRRVTVPPMGWTVVDAAAPADPTGGCTATAHALENDRLRVTWSDAGHLTSIYDKQARRELLPPGETGNQLLVYEDRGDAWDIPLDYRATAPTPMTLAAVAPFVSGPHAGVTFVWRYGESELRQRMWLTAGENRLEFETTGTWADPYRMLRVRFPVTIDAPAATCEIQYGSIRRSTSEETIRQRSEIEVAALRWADLSDADYGVALLNDCKYGYRVKGNALELTLLRSVPYPGPFINPEQGALGDASQRPCTDLGPHTFRYALCPHAGALCPGEMTRIATEFNQPLGFCSVPATSRGTARERSYFEITVGDVILDAVKPAETDLDRPEQPTEDVILRLFDPTGVGGPATVCVGDSFARAVETDLLERPRGPVPLRNGQLELEFRAYEVKTVRLQRD